MRRALAVLAALAFLAGCGDKPKAEAPPVVHVDGPDADTKRDDPIPLDESAQDGLERAEKGETATELADPLKQPGDRPEPTPGPLAADEIPGCRTAFVVNQSSRRGARVRVIVWHQTVSRENGWSSQNALTGLANRPSSGVSWSALVGRSGGRCTYTVPLAMKAWAQANANPFSAGIEVEAYGDEGAYVVGAGKAKLLAVTRHIGRRFAIPMRHAVVRWAPGCRATVVRSGILEHQELGACGGGHVDVTLTSSFQTLALIAEAGRQPVSRATDLRRRNVAAHKALRDRRCSKDPSRSRGACLTLHRRHQAIHRAARRERVRL